jgi:hypothetical protein
LNKQKLNSRFYRPRGVDLAKQRYNRSQQITDK